MQGRMRGVCNMNLVLWPSSQSPAANAQWQNILTSNQKVLGLTPVGVD